MKHRPYGQHLNRIIELEGALAGAIEALEYARSHGLDNEAINGNKVLRYRLEDARAVLDAPSLIGA